MVIQAQLADGRILEFPDETPDNVIDSAVKSMVSGGQDILPPVAPVALAPVAPVAQAGIPQQLPVAPQESFFGASVLEPLATAATGVIAEPLAGLAGIAATILPGEEGAGARAVEQVRQSLTFQPRTPEGQIALQETAEFLKPVGEAIQDVEKFIGDAVFEATDSPALAAASTTLPTAFLEGLGLFAGGRLARIGEKGVSKKKIRATLSEAAPEPETLKDIAGQVYDELDQSGATIKAPTFSSLVKKIEKAATKRGLDVGVTPIAFNVIKRLESEVGTAKTLTQVDILRQVAQNAAATINRKDASIGTLIISEIDDFLDNLKPESLATGTISAEQIGKKYKVARNLWGRARKSEQIRDAMVAAEGTASGFENGLRIEFNKILRNKKRSRFFNQGEISAMRQLVKGDVPQNLAKFLGKFALSEGRAINILSTSVGIAAGSLIGGPLGAVGVPLAGAAAKKVAANLTKNRAKFVDSLARAGNDGEKIVKAYLNTVPAKQRKVKDITDILSDPSIDLTELLFANGDIKLKNLGEIAAGKQTIAQINALTTVTELLPRGERDPTRDIPQEAIDLLKSDPSLAPDFDSLFGIERLSQRILQNNIGVQ